MVTAWVGQAALGGYLFLMISSKAIPISEADGAMPVNSSKASAA